MIAIKGLSKVFKTDRNKIQAVDDLTLSIREGEIFGVIGYSGAGKSTFVRLLNRLEEPTSGHVMINNQEVTALNTKELRLARRDIGMIFQHFNLLWSRTVRENIAFPLEIAGMGTEEREQRVNELMGLVGLADRDNAYPSELSGGQKQRVGIARALANNPKVLLCDEATSALDPETTNSILDLLVDINEKLGLTIIIITHEMNVIHKICNTVAVMEKGAIVEQGNVLDVFMRPEQPITKKFVQQIMKEDNAEDGIYELLETYETGEILQLHFVDETANQALISQLAKAFPVDINILQGKITQTKSGAYGTLFIQVEGEEAEINRVITYIKEETSVKVEVISHVQ